MGVYPLGGYRLTPRRLWNLYLGRLEHLLGRSRPRAYPVKLTVESMNACNLRCPACFTGAGLVGRARGAMPPDLFERLLAELGPYLFEVEFHNWGEPLLAPNLVPMIEAATRRGIATTVSTNLSFPYALRDAERLVASGLTVLGVSIDGARQATYEQYRVRGDLDLVLRNCAVVRDAKRRLGSATPRLVWEFHVFPHNVDDVAQARALAADLDMEISVEKGWVVGAEWDAGGAFSYFYAPPPERCAFLWRQAVVHNDGGVAPCCGTFDARDDQGRLALRPGDGGAATFRGVWAGERFAHARRFFGAQPSADTASGHVCAACPMTAAFAARRRGEPAVSCTAHDLVNYFWGRTRARTERP